MSTHHEWIHTSCLTPVVLDAAQLAEIAEVGNPDGDVGVRLVDFDGNGVMLYGADLDDLRDAIAGALAVIDDARMTRATVPDWRTR